MLAEALEKLRLVLDSAGSQGRALDSETLCKELGNVCLVDYSTRKECKNDHPGITVHDRQVAVEVVLADKVDDDIDTFLLALDDLLKACMLANTYPNVL